MPYNRKSLQNLHTPWTKGTSGNPRGPAAGWKDRAREKMQQIEAKKPVLVEAPKRQEVLCSVCRHSERAVIDGLLTLGVPLRALEKSYGVSRSATERHKQNHLRTFHDAEKARQVVDGINAIHVPMVILRRNPHYYDAESLINRLWDGLDGMLSESPRDELCRVIVIAISYLERIQYTWLSQRKEETERDFQMALKALESWDKK
jgi:hypothetical protein